MSLIYEYVIQHTISLLLFAGNLNKASMQGEYWILRACGQIQLLAGHLKCSATFSCYESVRGNVSEEKKGKKREKKKPKAKAVDVRGKVQ